MSDKDDNLDSEEVFEQLTRLICQLSHEDQVDLLEVLKARRGDQRESDRKPFFTEIIYTSEKGAHHEFSKDISETGMFIETPLPFEVGETLSITFPLEMFAKHVKITGKIARKSAQGIGVKFDHLDKAKQAILRQLLHYLEE